MIELEREKHIYRVDGKIVPANTRILEDQGIVDLSGIPRGRLDYKSALGTATHYAIHLHEHDNLDESSLHESIKPYFNGYRRFCEVYRFEPRHTELKLHSAKWGFCTTLDLQGPLYVNKEEVESIIEIKCTWAMNPSNAVQTAAQQIAFEETYPEIKIKARWGLQLKPSDSYELFQYKDLNDRNTFLAALTVYQWRVRNGLIKQENEK